MSGHAAIVVLQARTGSSRLPGKVLATIAGRPLLEHCIRRLVAADAGPLVVATTHEPRDDAVADLAAGCGVAVVRGPEMDVLGRFVLALDRWDARWVLRATGDNPAVDLDAPRRVLEYLAAGADYVVEAGLPVGAAVEGVRADLLRLAAAETQVPYDREHVTPFVRSRPERFRVHQPRAPRAVERPDLRLTVDTASDLHFVRCALESAGADRGLPSLVAIIAAADRLRPHQETR